MTDSRQTPQQGLVKPVTAVSRAAGILRHLGRNQEPMGVNRIARDLAQKVIKEIKAAKLKKIQVAIQGDELRVTGKKRDDLQAAIALIKEMKLEQPLQYVNFRD